MTSEEYERKLLEDNGWTIECESQLPFLIGQL